MNFEIVPFQDLPKELNFEQAIMHTSLKVAELSEKYGFRFFRGLDDLSAVDICHIRDTSGNFFMLLAREEFPEFETCIYTTTPTREFEAYVQEKIHEFLAATSFELGDVEQIWKFVDLKRPFDD